MSPCSSSLLHSTLPGTACRSRIHTSNTAGLIEKSGMQVTPDTRAVVQDALLFAAAWDHQFTYEPRLPFHAAEGDKDVSYVSGTPTTRSPPT